jgi:hypothetical protein
MNYIVLHNKIPHFFLIINCFWQDIFFDGLDSRRGNILKLDMWSFYRCWICCSGIRSSWLEIIKVKYFPKCFPELSVEDSVDDWIKDRINITQPSCNEKHSHCRSHIRQVKLDWNGRQDIASEKGNPTEEKTAWIRKKELIKGPAVYTVGQFSEITFFRFSTFLTSS